MYMDVSCAGVLSKIRGEVRLSGDADDGKTWRGIWWRIEQVVGQLETDTAGEVVSILLFRILSAFPRRKSYPAEKLVVIPIGTG